MSTKLADKSMSSIMLPLKINEYNNWGIMIKKYRKDHKLTQKQFANILKVSEIEQLGLSKILEQRLSQYLRTNQKGER